MNAFFKSTHKLSPRLSDSKAFVHVQKEEAGRRGRGLILCQTLCQVTSSSGSPLLLPSLLWGRRNYTHFRGKKIEVLGMGVLAKATQAVSSQARPQSRLNFHPLTLLNDNEPQSLGLFPALPLASMWFGENCLLLSTSVSSSELWKTASASQVCKLRQRRPLRTDSVCRRDDLAAGWVINGYCLSSRSLSCLCRRKIPQKAPTLCRPGGRGWEGDSGIGVLGEARSLEKSSESPC